MLPNTIKFKMKPREGYRYHRHTPARVIGTVFTLQDDDSTRDYLVTSVEFLEREPGIEVICVANLERTKVYERF